VQKFINIKAIFFLILFSIFLLHQSVPHFHHEHEVALDIIEHSHDHDQHHDDIPEKELGGLNGFIDLFLGMHVHGAISNENLINRQLTINQTVVEKVVSDVFYIKNYNVLKDIKEVEKPSIYHPPENYFNSYTSYFNLRGPPSLG
jgi:hypothetical protein